MENQPSLFPEAIAKELRDKGIKKAVDNANALHESWSETTFKFAVDFCKFHPQLLIEDIREAAKGFIPDPPSLRSWGSIAVRLIKEQKITRIGFKNAKSKKSHCTPVTVWKSNLYKG